MSSLVIELQKEAATSKIKVSDLLRKALLVATKLELPEFEKWIKSELYGYRDSTIPDYRTVPGELKGRDPFSGRWVLNYLGPEIVAVDTVASREGDLMFWVGGAEAMFPFEDRQIPSDATIVGLVDRLDLIDRK